ncbi:MAG: DUF790 family protein [Proteobacteria bacterium]|nr:DUF790 family protein [Pseudomonadota bacterium]
MLTRTLLITRFRNGRAYPYKLEVDEKNLTLASDLIRLFHNSVGRKRSEIDEEIKGHDIKKINPKIVQGLSQILFKRSDFSQSDEENPLEIRENVFSASAEYWKRTSGQSPHFSQHRKEILKALNIVDSDKIAQTESWLFSDIAGNQKMMSFEDIAPDKLVHRFNIEQVQGLLLNATRMEIKIHRRHNAGFRQVMQMMKFFGLMFEITFSEEEWFVLQIDGPGSVLENSRSYGMEIAQFFPAILLLSIPWHLKATLKVPNRPRKFILELTENNPFRTYYTEKGVWTHEKMIRLVERFNEKYADTHRAKTERKMIPLKNNRYLLPDFTIDTTADSEKSDVGKEIMVEWIHYLSETKIGWLKGVLPELPQNYLFAVKGKRTKMKKLIDSMGNHLLLFANELTAPALKKKMDELL